MDAVCEHDVNATRAERVVLAALPEFLRGEALLSEPAMRERVRDVGADRALSEDAPVGAALYPDALDVGVRLDGVDHGPALRWGSFLHRSLSPGTNVERHGSPYRVCLWPD